MGSSWRVGLVFPISYFHDKKKFDQIYSGEMRYEEDFEDKSQVGFNTGAITFIGKASFRAHYSDRPDISTLYDGIGEVFRRFEVKIVPQNVAVKVICYPNIAISIKLSGSKKEIAMVKFLSLELIAYPKKMKFYNKIVAENQKDGNECEGNQFRIKVRTLTGEIIPFKVDPNTAIYHLKLRIHDRKGISRNQIRIVFNGKQLEDEPTLAYYGIGDKDTVHMLLRLTGRI